MTFGFPNWQTEAQASKAGCPGPGSEEVGAPRLPSSLWEREQQGRGGQKRGLQSQSRALDVCKSRDHPQEPEQGPGPQKQSEGQRDCATTLEGEAETAVSWRVCCWPMLDAQVDAGRCDSSARHARPEPSRNTRPSSSPPSLCRFIAGNAGWT